MTYHSALPPMRGILGLVAALALFIDARAGEAQVLTGSISGIVRDEQGLVVEGAQVRLTSSSIIGGSAGSTTDARGVLRFPALTPGVYAIEVTMRGFRPSVARDVRVAAGSVINVTITLSVSPLSEQTQVSPARDATDPGLGVQYGQEQLLGMPSPRNGLFSFVGMSPFVSQTSRTTSLMSAAGGGVDQNTCFVDGSNVTSASNSVCRTEAGIDFAQAVRVQLLASAEYGGTAGAVIEVIMRQGSDRMLWDGSFYAQPVSLTSQPLVRAINFTGTTMSGYERQHYANASTTLGGPLIRNRAWYFGGYEHLRDEDSQPGGDPKYPKKFRQEKAFGKLNWQLAPGWRLMQSLHYETQNNRELPTSTKLVEATQATRSTMPAVTFGTLEHVSRANRVWEANGSRYEWSQDITRAAGDPTVPGRLDRTKNIASGAPSQIGKLKQIRWTGRVSLSQYQAGLLGTDHHWKVGGQFDRGEHRSLLVVPLGRRFEDNPPLPTRAFDSGPSNAGGRFNTTSAFVIDEFRAGCLVTIAAGVRFDWARGISPSIPQLDAEGNDTGVTIAGQGLLYSWKVLSPRVALAFKLTPDGLTVARASYGKFRQNILTGELSPDHPGVAPITSGIFDPVSGNLVNPVTTSPRDNVQVDSTTRAPTTDTFSFGVDRELSSNMTMSVTYIRKTGTDFIGWSDIRGDYRKEWITTDQGVTIPKYVLVAGSTRLFNLANQPDYSLSYNGFSIMLEKRHSRGWYASGSYTRSQASGLQPSGGTNAAGPQVATTGAPPASFAPPVTFGRDLNSLTNAGGRLPNDRPNLFRMICAADVPHTGITLSASLQHSSGKPWAYTADITPSQTQGVTRVLIEPRGSRRLSSQTMLDLRVSKALSLGRAAHVDLRFDVLNLLNDTAEESISSDRYDSPVLGVGNVFLDPRRVMLSVKMNVGK